MFQGADKAGQIPAFARIVTRGSVSSIRSDISSVDLFVVRRDVLSKVKISPPHDQVKLCVMSVPQIMS